MPTPNYRYTSPEAIWISVGDGTTIPADPANADYAALLAAGTPILPFVAPAPTADDVRREASRRMQALLGARDAAHLEIILATATREAVRLQNIRLEGANWTPTEAARVEELKAADAAIEAIRRASNVLEPQPPADYRADAHWL